MVYTWYLYHWMFVISNQRMYTNTMYIIYLIYGYIIYVTALCLEEKETQGANSILDWIELPPTSPEGMSWGWFNIKTTSYQYSKSHCGDKTILRPSYLYNGISYTGKMTYLYWIGPWFRPHQPWEATIKMNFPTVGHLNTEVRYATNVIGFHSESGCGIAQGPMSINRLYS